MEVNEALVKKASQGDEAAFAELYRAKARSILFQAYRIAGNMQDAEDIAQNVGIRLYQNIGKLRDPLLFNGWVHSVVANESKRMLRKEITRKNMALPLESDDIFLTEEKTEFLPQSYLENEEKRATLTETVEQLPQKRKELLMMYYYEDMSCAEIAAVTGMSVGAVKTSISRTRQEIKKKMEKRFGGFEELAGLAAGIPVIKSVIDIHVETLFPDAVVESVANKGVQAAFSAAKLPAVVAATQVGLATKVISVVVSVAVLLTSVTLLIRNLPDDGGAYEPYNASSATQEELVSPQYTGFDFVAEEDVYEGPVGGTINLVDNMGRVVLDSGVSNKGMEISIEDGGGNVLGTAPVNDDFTFRFPTVILERDNTYVFKMKESGAQLAVVLAVRSGEGFEEFAVNVSFTRSPQGRIVAEGFWENETIINPETIEFVSDYVRLERVCWEIVELGKDEVLAAGEEQILPKNLSTLYAAETAKEYTATFLVVDVFGNEAEYKVDFIVTA